MERRVLSWRVEDLAERREVCVVYLDVEDERIVEELIVNPAEVIQDNHVLTVIAAAGEPPRRFIGPQLFR